MTEEMQTQTDRPAKSTALPSRLLVCLTPSTGLLGGRTFLLVLKKLHLPKMVPKLHNPPPFTMNGFQFANTKDTS